MAFPPEHPEEHPSTYVVLDRSSQNEMLRLALQDRLFTKRMGGVLSEQPDPAGFQRVLDVGCGTGGWLIETARNYPTLVELIGIDISQKMVEYANVQARKEQMSDRVSFQTGDALRMLEFPGNYFGLVNQRFGMGWLRKWDWAKLLREYQRICKPGGIIRITEGAMGVSNSPALTRLTDLLQQAMHAAGYYFTPEKDGVIRHLADLFSQYSIVNVHTKSYEHAVEPQEAGADARLIYQTTLPFMRKWIKLPADYEDIYEQMLLEIQQPDFEITATTLTVWGEKRKAHKPSVM
jgi:ubiquinone/menaquinone biosynthesis C-methylase UbiE